MNTSNFTATHRLALTTFAALGAGAMAGDADASVIYNSGSVTLTGGQTWFLEGAGGTTAMGNVRLGSSFGSFPGSAVNGFRFADQGVETPRNLTLGATVASPIFTGSSDGESVSWTPGAAGASAGADFGAAFTIGTDAYAGFRFDTGSGTQYGWMSFTILPGTGGFRINSWAYETVPGVSINVGDGVTAVPEPTTVGLGLLALGLVGRAAYRRRSETSAKAA